MTKVVANTLLGWLFHRGISFRVPNQFDLCVECGLLWNSLDAASIRERLKAKGRPEDLDRLGLTEKAKPPIDDLDEPI